VNKHIIYVFGISMSVRCHPYDRKVEKGKLNMFEACNPFDDNGYISMFLNDVSHSAIC
jgi:hypothetical protein